jgi:hypothetical protein
MRVIHRVHDKLTTRSRQDNAKASSIPAMKNGTLYQKLNVEMVD